MTSGIPPPIVPAGQTYLQKYGSLMPRLLRATMGSKMTTPTSITYFMKESARLSLAGTLIFGVGILCRRSWSRPNGQR